MNNLQYGSRGEDVAALQKRLNEAGYSLTVDGAFGPATAAAVRRYQQANGLTVDGIVGPQTRASLYGTGATSSSYTETGVTTAGVTAPSYATPAAYESPYGARLSALYDAIVSRGAFAYDPEGDALYRRYRDRYQSAGRAAMDDALGRQSALTGGYGNSYAASAAQSAYQGYLSKLWDLLPTLQDRAYQRWKAEGEQQRDDYKLLQDAEKQAYQRYQDYVKQFNADRTYAQKEAANAAKSFKSASSTGSVKSAKTASKSTTKKTTNLIRNEKSATGSIGRALR